MRRSIVKLAISLAVVVGLLGQAQARVIISEFLAVNDKGLKDGNGERSDWIEIHNAGHATVDLTGWTFSSQ